MDKSEMKEQLERAVGEWVERTCGDVNLVKRFGSAEIKFRLTYEGEEDGQEHFEAQIEEVRRIEVSDETNPLQDVGSGRGMAAWHWNEDDQRFERGRWVIYRHRRAAGRKVTWWLQDRRFKKWSKGFNAPVEAAAFAAAKDEQDTQST